MVFKFSKSAKKYKDMLSRTKQSFILSITLHIAQSIIFMFYRSLCFGKTVTAHFSIADNANTALRTNALIFTVIKLTSFCRGNPQHHRGTFRVLSYALLVEIFGFEN